MQNANDHVDFYAYDGDTDAIDKICTASLVDGKVVFEGKEGERVEKMVLEMGSLKPYIKMGGYSFLAQLPIEFSGTYFYCSDVKEATLL
jgi:hypothetical protein